HLDGARAADQAQERVGDEGDDRDVESVAPPEVQVPECGEPGRQLLHQRAVAPAGRGAGGPERAPAPQKRRNRTDSGPPCTRRIAAPPATAADSAASEPGSRSDAAASSASPEKRRTNPLREAPTPTGYPSDAKARRCRSSRRFPSGLLPKPSPGSTAIDP